MCMRKKVIPFLLLAIFAPTVVVANTLKDAGVSGLLGEAGDRAGTSGAANFGTLIGNAISILLSMIGLLFLLLTIYAGFLWMTARGNDEQVGKAQKIMSGALIGLVLVIGAYAITLLVGSAFN